MDGVTECAEREISGHQQGERIDQVTGLGTPDCRSDYLATSWLAVDYHQALLLTLQNATVDL